jgi:formate dehydrogenase major subunit
MNAILDYRPIRRLSGTKKDHDCMVTTICQECAVGCGLCAYVCEGRLVDVQGDEKNPVSLGSLCAAGTSFVRDLYDPERIVKPADRKARNEDFGELAGWDDALDLLADRLKRIRDQHGSKALLIHCDPAAGLDFFLAAKRFAALWGTPFVFNPLNAPHGSYSMGATNPSDCHCFDWIHSRCLFIVSADPASTHPVAFRWILEAQKNGAKVVVADTRFTKTMSKADLALRIRPYTANVLGGTLMRMILENDLCGLDLVRNEFADVESWETSFERISLEAAAETIGVASGKLKETAFLLAKKGPVHLITGRSIAQSPGYGIWRTIAAVMAWTGGKGGGWRPLDSGLPPLSVTADLQAANPEQNGHEPEVDSSISLTDFLAGVASSRIDPPKAIIWSGNCLHDPFSHLTQGNEGAPLTAYFGLMANQTAHASHMVFPAQAWAERDGLFFTNDWAIQWGRKIVDSPNEARSGLDFWIGLAKRFGWEEQFPWQSDDGSADSEAFFDWLLNQNPATAGCKIEILKNASDNGEFVYWPSRQERLRQTTFTLTPATELEELRGESENLYPLYLDVPDAVFMAPITSDGGAFDNAGALQINPEIASALAIQTRDEVLIHGRDRIVEARAWVTRMVPRWLVYLQQGSTRTKVLVYKKGQSSQEALGILNELLS